MKVNALSHKRLAHPAWLAVLLMALIASACQPGITPVARPTPAVLAVQITPALRIFSKQFQDCSASLPGAGLVLQDLPAAATLPPTQPLALRWGAGGEVKGFAAVIGQEQLVLVVNPQNPLDQISLSDLQAIYQGNLRDWKKPVPSGEIHAWAYPAGDDVQVVFESAVLNGSPIAGQVASPAPNPAAMREAVAKDVAAVGFLPHRWVDASVKTLSIKDLDPARLDQPILALSKLEPKDPEKSWLLCLQERLK